MTIINRNRYGNVQPWSQSRIKLKTPIGGSDYVNASPIRLRSRSRQARSRRNTTTAEDASRIVSSLTLNEVKYIATQGPKDGQYAHFWHMVMQESVGDVGVVIMLTQLYEGNKEKCAQYFPADTTNSTIEFPLDEEKSSKIQDDGDPFLDPCSASADTDIVNTDTENGSDTSENATSTEATSSSGEPQQEQVQLGKVTLLEISRDNSIGCDVRRLRLEIDDQGKEIVHYLYNGWPDFGKPEAEDRKALLELTQKTRIVAGRSPRIVHCSAGVGRTGTFIALDFLLGELEEGRLLPRPKTEAKQVATPENRKTETWGKSGPTRQATPEADEKLDGDLIFDTVNALREQRMMMVMNEIQLSFLYEVMKEAFMDKYQEKEVGPVVSSAGEEELVPKKMPKIEGDGDMFESTKVGKVNGEEDTVSESEAETEIAQEEDTTGLDPYDAVAPKTIREGMSKDEEKENQVEGHEVH